MTKPRKPKPCPTCGAPVWDRHDTECISCSSKHADDAVGRFFQRNPTLRDGIAGFFETVARFEAEHPDAAKALGMAAKAGLKALGKRVL